MSNNAARYENMLFNYETSTRTDFRDGEIEPLTKTVYKGKQSCLRIKPQPLKDLHALTNWRVPNVPFNLMHKPKDVVQENPRQPQKPYFQPVDHLQKEVQRTRPRLVITPTVYLDNADESDRQRLVKDIYLTTLTKTVRESRISFGENVRAPLSPVLAPAHPIFLEKLVAPYVSPEWRMDTAAWENRQLRSYCEPTKYFWLARTPKCEVCKETEKREAQQKTKRLAQRQ